MADKLRVSLKHEPAIIMNRIALSNEKLVYVICADRNIRYPWGKTPIVYIGTTKTGVSRIAASAAFRAEEVLGRHGVKSFAVRIVTCKTQEGIKSWVKLERALLLEFRAKFGATPICNTAGKKITPQNEFDIFVKSRISAIIDNLTKNGEVPAHEITD